MILSATKLNATYLGMKKKLGRPSFDVDFWSGDTTIALPLLAKKILPFSKVAILYSKESYNLFANHLTDSLKKNGNPVINVVMDESFKDNLDSYSDIFNLAEDVRLVVALDERFYSVAKYFASLRQIDCVSVVRKLNAYGVLAPEVTLTNLDRLESVNISAKGHILFDYEEIKKDKQSLPNAYAFVVSHTLALVDYRVNATITEKDVNREAYYLASQAIVNAYSLFINKREDFFSILIESFFSLEIANIFTNNCVYKSFSANFVAKTCNQNDYAGSLLKVSALLAKIYDLFCSDKYDKILEYPNYITRAEFISNTLKISSAEATKHIVENYKIIEKNPSKAFKSLKKIQKDITSFIQCSSIMINTFTVLGGKLKDLDEKDRQAIKHAGDLVINGMSVVRESGITELI